MNIDQCLSKAWLVCPHTGCWEPRGQITIHSIPGGRAVWWRCSTCYRWHIIEILTEQNKHVISTEVPKGYKGEIPHILLYPAR